MVAEHDVVEGVAGRLLTFVVAPPPDAGTLVAVFTCQNLSVCSHPLAGLSLVRLALREDQV